MISHPDRELGSFADEGGAPEGTAAIAAHLAGCARCGRRVEELRAVRRLLAASPTPVPSRSLVPRLAAPPVWLRPLRSLASVGAGAFLFLFLASAVLQSGSNLGGGTTAAERAAARGQLSAPATPGGPRVFDAATATAGSVPAGVVPVAPLASQTPEVRIYVDGSPATAPLTDTRRDFGPPPWVFAALALLAAALALLAHRRLHRA